MILITMFQTWVTVLQSWFRIAQVDIKKAMRFYGQLLTNKVGFPKWLWIATLVSWLTIVISICIHGI